ncbi:MAG: ORF6N domain-containing protein, partial [Bacilli bacterium]|nr:ORF6N domain-containing protein [Bacilli bacterium]
NTFHDRYFVIEEKRKINEIYFNGQIYDAYSKIQEIFQSANKKLIIIDAYADNTLLDIIKRLNVEVVIITKANNLLTHQDILKYNKQYHNLKVIYDNTFHDRYFVIDEKLFYHCGASINRIGYKTFSITLIGDDDVCNILMNRITKIIL